MSKLGFKRSKFDNCIYIKRHVDDNMLIVELNTTEIMKVKEQLKVDFEMKHLGEANKIL